MFFLLLPRPGVPPGPFLYPFQQKPQPPPGCGCFRLLLAHRFHHPFHPSLLSASSVGCTIELRIVPTTLTNPCRVAAILEPLFEPCGILLSVDLVGFVLCVSNPSKKCFDGENCLRSAFFAHTVVGVFPNPSARITKVGGS